MDGSVRVLLCCINTTMLPCRTSFLLYRHLVCFLLIRFTLSMKSHSLSPIVFLTSSSPCCLHLSHMHAHTYALCAQRHTFGYFWHLYFLPPVLIFIPSHIFPPHFILFLSPFSFTLFICLYLCSLLTALL